MKTLEIKHGIQKVLFTVKLYTQRYLKLILNNTDDVLLHNCYDVELNCNCHYIFNNNTMSSKLMKFHGPSNQRFLQ